MRNWLKPIPVLSALITIAFLVTTYLAVSGGLHDGPTIVLFVVVTTVFIALAIFYLVAAVMHNKWIFWK